MGIPLTPQTEPKNYPVWEDKAPPGKSGHGYPRMITRPFTEKDRDEWLRLNRKVDRVTREEYFEERVPYVGAQVPYLATAEMVNKGLCRRAGEPVVADSEAHEREILTFLGVEKADSGPPTVDVRDIVQAETATDQLQAENDRLRELLAEKRKLEAELAGEAPKKAKTTVDKRTKAYKAAHAKETHAKEKARKGMSAAELAGGE